jgi:hypothetical protein
VWSYDFVSAKTYDGRTVRMLNMIEEHSRECLLIRSERRWSSAKVIEALADVMVIKGVPEHIQAARRVPQRRDLLLNERDPGAGRRTSSIHSPIHKMWRPARLSACLGSPRGVCKSLKNNYG